MNKILTRGQLEGDLEFVNQMEAHMDDGGKTTPWNTRDLIDVIKRLTPAARRGLEDEAVAESVDPFSHVGGKAKVERMINTLHGTSYGDGKRTVVAGTVPTSNSQLPTDIKALVERLNMSFPHTDTFANVCLTCFEAAGALEAQAEIIETLDDIVSGQTHQLELQEARVDELEAENKRLHKAITMMQNELQIEMNKNEKLREAVSWANRMARWRYSLSQFDGPYDQLRAALQHDNEVSDD